MELDIQAIADKKIRAMHESGEIRTQIENGVSKLVLDAVDSALGGYSLKREIENVVSNKVSSIASTLGFSAYNGFISKTLKEITENVMREDVAQKIQKVFDDMLIVRHDGIKLSEILQSYRDYLLENVDESDKYDFGRFTCEVETKEDDPFTWHTVSLHEKSVGVREEPEIQFKILAYRDAERAKISTLYLNGVHAENKFPLGSLNPIESLLANLYFNETEIILDVDDVDIDDSYDIDF